MTDEDTSGGTFTDEEQAFLRHARFGELPPRVRPDELVELTETDPKRDVPDPVGDLSVARMLRGMGA